MAQCLEARPDQSAVELLIEFQARYPGHYSRSHLRTLRRRLQVMTIANENHLLPPSASDCPSPYDW
jgi:hypothetical protein